MTDIFEFWSPQNIARDAKEHPEDAPVLATTNQFELDCLPNCIRGPLKTAPVVLLYLAPGWSEKGAGYAGREEYIARAERMRTGKEPLPEADPSNPGWQWMASHTKVFGEWDELRTCLAFLNLVPYHSRGSFKDRKTLHGLPSRRVALQWTKAILFPQARRGERIVICMRSAKKWGLERGTRDGLLYSPETTRSGHMIHGDMRKEIVTAARKAIASPQA